MLEMKNEVEKMRAEIKLDKQFFVDCFYKIGKLAEDNRDYWTQLDSDIGDGDHGINLSIGFREVTKQLPELALGEEDLSQFLRKIGMILLSKVGGASGPLYGSLFMKMGDDYKGQNEVSFDEFVGMLDSGIAAVIFRGKAELGDKTMVDALLPGVNHLKENANQLQPAERMSEAVGVMKAGADSTVDLIAKKGRAVRLGKRSIGHRDPGAESSWMLMNVFATEIGLVGLK